MTLIPRRFRLDDALALLAVGGEQLVCAMERHITFDDIGDGSEAQERRKRGSEAFDAVCSKLRALDSRMEH